MHALAQCASPQLLCCKFRCTKACFDGAVHMFAWRLSRPSFRTRRTSGGKEFYTEWEESFDSFDQMGLKENLLRGIYAYGEQPQ